MESIQQQTQECIGKINDKWEEYKASVNSLREMMQLPDDEAIEWDRRNGFAAQVEKVSSRLRTFEAGRDDANWADQCLDDGYELCSDMAHWTESVQVLISCWDDEDAASIN